MHRMRKIAVLTVAFWLLTACTAQPPESAGGSPSSATVSSVAVGTLWNAVSAFDSKGGGVWRYVYAVQNEEAPQWQICPVYRQAAGSGVSAWYPPDGAEVSVGVNELFPQWLEITASGEMSGMAGLQFVAPANGRYALSGTVRNEWSEACEGVTVAHGGKDLLTLPLTAKDTRFTQTVELQAGDTLTMFARSPEKGDWLALYWQVQIEYLGRNKT